MSSRPDDLRLFDHIKVRSREEISRMQTEDSSPPPPHIVLLSFPFDIGAKRNGGRVGAAAGPAAIHKHLLQQRVGALHNAEHDIDIQAAVHISQVDIGYSVSNADKEEPSLLSTAHRQLTAAVFSYLSIPGVLPCILGGSNDQSYPNTKALMQHILTSPTPSSSSSSSSSSPSLLVINIDAHLDVRPLIQPGNLAHSGSPFRLLLEDEQFTKDCQGRFIEFAAQSPQCSAKHAAYVKQRHGGHIHWIDSMRAQQELPSSSSTGSSVVSTFHSILQEQEHQQQSSHIFVSFDVDSISSSVMPGVSAPSPLGLTAYEACSICRMAGQEPRVKLLDFSEFNPAIEEYLSARLLATLLYYFILGVAQRARAPTAAVRKAT